MKKISIFMAVVLLIVTCGNVQPVKAEGAEYIYREVQEGSEAPYKAWFVNGVEISGNPGVTVTFGSVDAGTLIKGLSCTDANVTVYVREGVDEDNRPLCVYGVTCFNSTVTIKGNVENLFLEDEFKFDSAKVNEGTVNVDGSVNTVEWYTTSEFLYMKLNIVMH